VRRESGAQLRQLALGLQPAQALGRLEHGGGRPAQRQGRIAPARDVAADAADRAHDGLDDVGAGARAAQLLRQAQPNDGEDLIEPLQDRPGHARRLALQAAGEGAEQRLRALGVVEVPGLPQHTAGRGLQMPGQAVENVARLVDLQRWIGVSRPKLRRIAATAPSPRR
jgi:hypothetical protein